MRLSRLLIIALLAATTSLAAARSQAPLPGQISKEELKQRLSEAKEQPFKLLELSALVDQATAQELRWKAGKILQAKRKSATQSELYRFAQQFNSLPRKLRKNRENLIAIWGKPNQISRQLLFRRYKEQWHYRLPRRHIITWERSKGREFKISAVVVFP